MFIGKKPILITMIFLCLINAVNASNTSIVYIDSDIRGAEVILDNQHTGNRTPTTISINLEGEHLIILQLNNCNFDAMKINVKNGVDYSFMINSTSCALPNHYKLGGNYLVILVIVVLSLILIASIKRA
jgi:hypothetical protein